MEFFEGSRSRPFVIMSYIAKVVLELRKHNHLKLFFKVGSQMKLHALWGLLCQGQYLQNLLLAGKELQYEIS